MRHVEEHMENAIIRTLVEDALDLGYTVIHHNGEEITASARVWEERTKEDAANVIMGQIRQCDEERLIFRKNGQRAGSVLLIYGNGDAVISDYTDNEEMERIVAGASELADMFAAAA